MTTPTATRTRPPRPRHARPVRPGRQRSRKPAATTLQSRVRRFETAVRLAWRAIRHAPAQALLAALPTAAGAAAVAAPCALALGLRLPATAGLAGAGGTLTMLLVGLPGCALLSSGGRLVRTRHRRRSAELLRIGIGRAQARTVTMLEAAADGLVGATGAVLAVTLGGSLLGRLFPAGDRLAAALGAADARPLALAGVVAGTTALAGLAAFAQREPADAGASLRAPLTWYGVGPLVLATGLVIAYVVPTFPVAAHAAASQAPERAPAPDDIASPLRFGVALVILLGVAASLPFLLRCAGRLLVPRGNPAVGLLAGRGIEAAAGRDTRVLAPAAVLTTAVTAVAILRLLHASPVAVLGVPVSGTVGQALVVGAVVAVLASGVALLGTAYETPDRGRRVAALYALGARQSTSRRALVLAATLPSACSLGIAVLVGGLLGLPGALRAARAGVHPAAGDVSVPALAVPLAAAAVILLTLPAIGAAVASRRSRRLSSLRFD